MNTLQNKLLKKRPQLSELEKQVLDYILQNSSTVTTLTADLLAKELFISTATISRTAQRLGFKGFQELKYAIAQDNKELEEPEKALYSKQLSDLCHSIEYQLHETLERFKQIPLEEIIHCLKKAKVVELFGMGGSLANCIHAARKLTFLGKTANARIDWDELQITSKTLTPEDFAIIVSNSGETPSVIEYAINLQQQGVPTLAIIGTKNSSLEALTTYKIQAVVDMLYFDEVDLSSRVPFSAVLDILLIQFARTFDQG
ncbi:DNA-binding protein [Tetragenococcus osmophilus]|uniref:DNA-binding protein n=1 Tax=Tetragenococcus osmophilus TaxID=526944 RepID=A0AA37XL41_9ENTE|nr:MurR/RpiR family transcriptional regulator [Tetragenococcus osmophilus]AYW47315.1 DNA-binding protein [Tetragenococcus osmophilus]GMA73153.1 RpiR family transcriptional regulator [Tetragenococcus osmophilus]